MKCNNCGSEIDNFAKFCPACGSNVEYGDMNTTKSNLSFQPNQCTEELEDIVVDLRIIEENYKKVEQNIKAKMNLKNEYQCYQLGAAIAVFMLGLFLLGFFITTFPFVSENIAMITVIICMIGGIFLAIKVYKFTGKLLKSSKENASKRYDNYIDNYKKTCLEYYNHVFPVLSKWLPEDYWYATAVQTISKYLRNNRADTMKEALNLYEEEMHRLKMENLQESILRENQKQTAYAAIIAFNTSIHS